MMQRAGGEDTSASDLHFFCRGSVVEVSGMVKAFLSKIGAPDTALEWADGYGNDLKRAWEECDHPEVLLPFACGMGVSDWDVFNATIEVMRAHLECVPLHKEVEHGLSVIEQCVSGSWVSDELLDVLQAMSRLSRETKRGEPGKWGQRSSYGAVAHVCEAFIAAQNCQMSVMMSRVSSSVVLAAQSRAEVLTAGSTRTHTMSVTSEGLRGTAPIVRKYIPYESVVGGFISLMQEGELDVPSA